MLPKNYPMLFMLCAGIGFFSILRLPALTAQEIDSEELVNEYEPRPNKILQNRFFTKRLRPEIGLLAGSMLSESYTNTNLMGFRLGLFMTEWVGFEFQTIKTKVSDSQDRKTLKKMEYRDVEKPDDLVHPNVPVNEIQGIADLSAIYAPLYGKINLLDKMILYTDLYFTAGLSNIQTDQGRISAINLGGGQRIYIKKSWSVRLDLRSRIYSEEQLDKKVQKRTLSLDLGLAYFLF